MKVLYIEKDLSKKIVLENENNLYYLDSLGFCHKDINELIESEENLENLDFKNAKKLSGQYKILSPIQYPRQDIICIGMNYIDHKDEVEKVSRKDFKKEVDTIYFSKRANKVLGPKDTISLNEDITSCLDYEIELALIIGKDAKNVKKANASEYIFGFSVFNDLSARDLQTKYKQWYYGKSFDDSSVMGPAIVLNDGSLDYNNLSLKTKINGQIRQNNNTKNMILSIDEMIEDLSKSMTLKKGTIIATGTPSGVGMSDKNYLKKNDKIEMEIENIGKLQNIVK